MTQTETVLRLKGIEKTYQLGKIDGITTIQEWWKNMVLPKSRGEFCKLETRRFRALHDVTCDIHKGERVAVIGRNGAGKSTLLKLLSRVTSPDKGTIYIKGKISSMLEVGTGFHRELTGRENIYLNGAILGMKREEIDTKIEDIIEFSECREFIDTPVKRYSSGMYVKLAFSVIAHLNADIFLMDEVLAVGDMMFQKKCLAKMREISENQSKTILYVSHNMETVRELCNRCIVLDEGSVIYDGEVEPGIRIYMKDILEIKHTYRFQVNRNQRFSTQKLRITEINLENPYLNREDHELRMRICFAGRQSITGLHIRFTVYDEEDRVVGTSLSERFCAEGTGSEEVQVSFSAEELAVGDYSADIAIVEPHGDSQTRHEWIQRAVAFRVEDCKMDYAVNWNRRKWGAVKFRRMRVRIMRGSK